MPSHGRAMGGDGRGMALVPGIRRPLGAPGHPLASLDQLGQIPDPFWGHCAVRALKLRGPSQGKTPQLLRTSDDLAGAAHGEGEPGAVTWTKASITPPTPNSNAGLVHWVCGQGLVIGSGPELGRRGNSTAPVPTRLSGLFCLFSGSHRNSAWPRPGG